MRFSKHQTRARPSQGGPFHQPVTPPLSTQLAAVCAERYAFQSYAEASPRTPPAPPVSNGVQALVKCFGCGHVVEREKAHPNVAWRVWWCGPCAATRPASVMAPDPAEPPAAPPVDEELERERARLVGKRVRWSERGLRECGHGHPLQHLTRADGAHDNLVVGVDRGHGMLIARFEDKPGTDGWHASMCDRYLEPIPEEKPRECRFCDLAVGEEFYWRGARTDPQGARKKTGPRSYLCEGEELERPEFVNDAVERA